MKKYILFLLSLINNYAFGMNIAEQAPDDIATTTNWIKDPTHPEATYISADNNINLRNMHIERLFYRPPKNIKNLKDLIVCLFIYDKKIKSLPNYAHVCNSIKRFSSWYANIRKKNLELLLVDWSENGKNQETGNNIYNLLRLRYKNAEKVLVGYGDSCNVNNYITHLTPNHEPIDLLIHIACQHRICGGKKYPFEQPINYKTLFYFFSIDDYNGVNDNRIYFDIGKSFFLYGLSVAIPITTPLALAVMVATEGTNLTNEVKDFEEQNNKITCGINIKMNGTSPKLSTMLNVLNFIPEILQKVLIEHHSGLKCGYGDCKIDIQTNNNFNLQMESNNKFLKVKKREGFVTDNKPVSHDFRNFQFSLFDSLSTYKYLEQHNDLINFFSKDASNFLIQKK